MKKTYVNPKMFIVDLKMQYQLMAGSDRSYNPADAEAADESTKNGGWNSRQGSFFDDEDDY